MPCEIRYLRYDYVLGTEQSSVVMGCVRSWTGFCIFVWGMRVWKYNEIDGEVEITNGTPIILGLRDGVGSGIQEAEWDCPETSGVDELRVRIYVQNMVEGVWYECPLSYFRTEDLEGVQLDVVTWDLYSWTQMLDRLPWYDAIYRWGHPSYNSRIENFCYTLVLALKMQYSNGFVCVSVG